METVLVVGATGNVGISVIIASLRKGYQVLAIVRNQASAEKIYAQVGTKEGITTTEADVTSDVSMQAVVDRVRAGELPQFQHVYSSVGTFPGQMPLYSVDLASVRQALDVTLSNFNAYRATVPYLLEQKHPNSTFTVICGSSPELGIYGAVALAQAPVQALGSVACRELAGTNIRANEVCLAWLVVLDDEAEKVGPDKCMKASDFARHYEEILARPEISGCRVSIYGPEDVAEIKYKKKLEKWMMEIPLPDVDRHFTQTGEATAS
ncbi:Putative NAD(P)-binding domain superfamily [Septoria linicola]|uniref:NAD(P)-binding domain superfamily n=1 Tax=Septoria linicola TaxID=215465 RepID=A0A9Q9B789_9PEZI|nr:putative NAD(P)-binding domain superfamily [Septoria linicola]USW57656.1 Putative NAD(P)-binding domain superfamily [Septoria linicola]